MKSFDELNLSAPLMRAIADLGYTAPSPIQQQALPILMGPSTDFLGLAATGTVKTAAFGIPLYRSIASPSDYHSVSGPRSSFFIHSHHVSNNSFNLHLGLISTLTSTTSA